MVMITSKMMVMEEQMLGMVEKMVLMDVKMQMMVVKMMMMVFYPGLNKLLQMLILPISCEMKVLTLMRNTTKCLVPHLHQQDLQHRHLDPLALCVTNLPLIPHPVPTLPLDRNLPKNTPPLTHSRSKKQGSRSL